MYDPLGSASSPAFGNFDSIPPWPTTPHTPNSPIPNLRRAATPDRISDPSPFEKQPQIYGQPEPGLISPATNPASNGGHFEKPGPYLKVRITGLDRNRRDILVRFDAQVCSLDLLLETYFRMLLNSDKPFELHWNGVPKRVEVICRVSATLRCPYTQQPADYCPRSPTCTNIRSN